MTNISCKHIHLVHRKRTANQEIKDEDKEDIGYDQASQIEIEELTELVCNSKVSSIKSLKQDVEQELSILVTEVNNCLEQDEEHLKLLLKKLRAAKYSFISVKENRLLDTIPSIKQISSNKNTERQRRFVSTKKRRKSSNVKLAKPSQQEREDFLIDLPDWIEGLDKKKGTVNMKLYQILQDLFILLHNIIAYVLYFSIGHLKVIFLFV